MGFVRSIDSGVRPAHPMAAACWPLHCPCLKQVPVAALPFLAVPLFEVGADAQSLSQHLTWLVDLRALGLSQAVFSGLPAAAVFQVLLPREPGAIPPRK